MDNNDHDYRLLAEVYGKAWAPKRLLPDGHPDSRPIAAPDAIVPPPPCAVADPQPAPMVPAPAGMV